MVLVILIIKFLLRRYDRTEPEHEPWEIKEENMTEPCFICGNNTSKIEYDCNDGYTRYNCKNCGFFKVHIRERAFDKNRIASYLYYECKIPSKLNIDKRCLYIGYRDVLEKVWLKDSTVRAATSQEIETWYPRTFSKKINAIINAISLEFSEVSEVSEFSELLKFDGGSIEMTYEQCCSAFFVKRYNPDNSETTKKERDDQIEFVKSYLLKKNLFKVENNSEKVSITTLPGGFERIYYELFSKFVEKKRDRHWP